MCGVPGKMMNVHDQSDLQAKLAHLKTGIRGIAHDIGSPLGVLRMAAYYLQAGSPDAKKREEYLKMISDTVDKVEAKLEQLRALGEDPSGDGEARPPTDERKR